MKIGVEFHRTLSHDKLFCSCRYDPHLSCEDSFTVYNSKSKVRTRYLSSKYYCEYERDVIPSVLNLKLLRKALVLASGIPKVRVLRKVLFCRKHIYDGSLSHGYQKTACIAYGGQITLSSGKIVPIDKVYLEEDSCSKVHGTYCVGRQGTPLLEISTTAVDMSAKELRELLIELDRVTDRHKNLPLSSFSRRQDINVSVPGHPRVEIKGVDRLGVLEGLLELEEKRQESAIKEGHACGSTRRLEEDLTTSHLRPLSSGLRLFPQTEVPPLDTSVLRSKRTSADVSSLPHFFRFKNNRPLKHLRSLLRRDESLVLSPGDWSLLRDLYDRSPRGHLKLFKAYLRGETSEHSLRRGDELVPSWKKEKLDELWGSRGSDKEFYLNYKVYFPRNYSPSDTKRV